jgi:hypothetical protein
MSRSSPIWSAKRVWVSLGLAVLIGACSFYVRAVDRSSKSHREMESIRADISRVKRENARLLKQLSVIGDRLDQQGSGSQIVADSSISEKSPKEVPARAAERISKLKEFLSAHPEMADPEMRLLKDDDWVFPVSEIRLETEASKRKALAQVRMQAQSRLGEMVAAALRDYLDANNGQQPSNAAQLAPYLADLANADLLQGFGKPDPTAPSGCLFQKVSAVDDWYGSTCYVSDNQFYAHGTGPGLAVEQAIVAFQRATGNPPNEASQIIPYLQNAVSPAIVNAVFDGLRPSPNTPPVTSQGGGMYSTGGSGNPP